MGTLWFWIVAVMLAGYDLLRPGRSLEKNRRARFPRQQIPGAVRRHPAPGVKNPEFIAAFHNGRRVVNVNASAPGGGGLRGGFVLAEAVLRLQCQSEPDQEQPAPTLTRPAVVLRHISIVGLTHRASMRSTVSEFAGKV